MESCVARWLGISGIGDARDGSQRKRGAQRAEATCIEAEIECSEELSRAACRPRASKGDARDCSSSALSQSAWLGAA